MRLLILLASLGIAGVLLAGCVNVDADASEFSLGGNQRTTSPPPDPDSDPRAAGELRRENGQLRERLAKLENDRENWQRTIDRQEDLIDDLEDQKDRLEDQRDRYKDALDD